MKNKKLLLLSFFIVSLFLIYGVQQASAAEGACNTGEVCTNMVKEGGSWVSPPGKDCYWRNVCTLGTATQERACCKPESTSPNTTPPPVTNTGSGTSFTNPLTFTNVEGFLGGILSAIQKIIVVLALVFIMIGAVMILASAGNSGMVEKGKEAITMALVGLALGIAAPSLLKELSVIIGWVPRCNPGDVSCVNVGNALTLSAIAMNVLNFLLGTMGIVALVMLVIGAIMYLTSAGDEDRIDKGKEIFKYSLLGVVLAMSSMVLVTQIARFFTTTPSTSTPAASTMTAPGTPGFIGPPSSTETTLSTTPVGGPCAVPQNCAVGLACENNICVNGIPASTTAVDPAGL